MEVKKKVAHKPKTTQFQITEDHVLQFQWQDKDYAIPLKKSTPAEVVKLRMTRKPGFVLRDKNGKLYCATIPNCHLIPEETELETHMCRNCVKGCKCEKIHDNSLEGNMSNGKKYVLAMEMSKRLEKYPFITYGYQIFNALDNNELTVCQCKHFTNYRPKSYLTPQEIRNAKQTLYDFLYDCDYDE